MLFDPGTDLEYDSNTDWEGQVVDGNRGKRLGEGMGERVFKPPQMDDIAATRTDAMKARTAMIHARSEDGSVTLKDEFAMPDIQRTIWAGMAVMAWCLST